jgi:hypothetical protein
MGKTFLRLLIVFLHLSGFEKPVYGMEEEIEKPVYGMGENDGRALFLASLGSSSFLKPRNQQQAENEYDLARESYLTAEEEAEAAFENIKDHSNASPENLSEVDEKYVKRNAPTINKVFEGMPSEEKLTSPETLEEPFEEEESFGEFSTEGGSFKGMPSEEKLSYGRVWAGALGGGLLGGALAGGLAWKYQKNLYKYTDPWVQSFRQWRSLSTGKEAAEDHTFPTRAIVFCLHHSLSAGAVLGGVSLGMMGGALGGWFFSPCKG